MSRDPLITPSPIDANPLLEPWTGPFEAPPFDRFEPRQFPPAFDAALKQARTEIDAVAADPAAATFANTIEALERSGRSLDKVASVFFNLAGAHTNDELQAIEREIAPKLARHHSETYLNEALFKRIDALKADAGKLGLSAEQARVLDRYHLDFTRAGAGARPRPRRDWPRSLSGWRRWRQNSVSMCSRTKKTGSCCSMKAILRVCQISSSRAPRASRSTAAIPANMR